MLYTCESFSCKRQGLIIRGTQYRPEGEKVPAVILSHGFKANESFVRKYAEAIAAGGFAAFSYDFCGGCTQGKSDGKSTEMSVLTEKEDLLAVMEYVTKLPYVDAEKLVLMGCSQGGFVSALAAASQPERVHKLILFYPALCIPDSARRGKMAEVEFDPRNIPETMMSGDMPLGRRYAADVQAMDPWREIAGYCGPVLLVHGTADEVVDISYSRKAADIYRVAAQNTGTPMPQVRLVGLEGAGHGFYGRYAGLAIQAVQGFLGLPS